MINTGNNSIKGFIPVTVSNNDVIIMVNYSRLNDIYPNEDGTQLTYSSSDYVLCKESVEQVLSLIQANQQL